MSIRAFERGGEMRESNLRLVRFTFEAAGIVCEQEGEMVQGGIRVRLKSSDTQSNILPDGTDWVFKSALS